MFFISIFHLYYIYLNIHVKLHTIVCFHLINAWINLFKLETYKCIWSIDSYTTFTPLSTYSSENNHIFCLSKIIVLSRLHTKCIFLIFTTINHPLITYT